MTIPVTFQSAHIHQSDQSNDETLPTCYDFWSRRLIGTDLDGWSDYLIITPTRYNSLYLIINSQRIFTAIAAVALEILVDNVPQTFDAKVAV